MKIRISTEWQIIIGFAILKLIIHLLVSTNYELQRDAYLYLALGDHPAWGYVSVPPSIAFFGKLTQFLFGSSAFAVRIFPALLGGTSIIIIGLIVKELNGKRFAIFLACLAFLLSPAYLRTNALFQPVSFNQFYWLLSGYLILKLAKTRNTKAWIPLFIVFGLAFLNKYSISFFMLGFFVSLLLVSDRKLYKSKHFLIGAAIGLVMILPNLIWQYNHNWPVIHHMAELHRTQLVHVSPVNFILEQFLMNFQALIIWLFGLVTFLFFKEEKQFRVLGLLYVSTVLIIMLGSGKSYYTLGLYPLLIAMGAYSIEKYVTGKLFFLRYLVILLILIIIPFLPYGLPILKPAKMHAYAQKTSKYLGHAPLRWEDGKIHKIPQDYADMIGWEALSKIVLEAYNQLTPVEKTSLLIFGDSYAEAAAVKHYCQPKGLPEPVSFDDNFVL